jgi:hypothetical protein
MRRALGLRWSALVLGWVASGCAYYNAMWSAERYAKDARQLEVRGQESEARSQWARAAEKAEAVVARHPRSRWADDALVLQAEGLARSGSCEEAAGPIARARATVKDAALRERVELADAECALAAAHPIQAAAALVLPLASQDAGRRSRAELLAGQAAALRFDYDAAVEHLQRSREPAALPGRARALIALGRTAEAGAALDALGGSPLYASDRGDVLAQFAAVAGPDAGTTALDRLLARGRLPFAEQTQLLIADADRQLAHLRYDAAAAQYRRAVLVAPPATAEAMTARVGLQRVLIARATRRADLGPVADELTKLSREEVGTAPAKQLLEFVKQAMTIPETPGARFRVAELARDSLDAPALAGQFFLDVAAGDTGSLYAPKALVAALALLPERRDSITGVLDTRYAASPYTRAFHGEASLAYAAAEDSLARELGVEVAQGSPAGAARGQPRFDVPIPGPRGPQLEEPAEGGGAAPAARAPGAPPRAGARPPPTSTPTRDRPKQPERP